MEFRDYYQTLGVPKNATEADIKKAYRKLARQFHPDLNPGNKAAEERFKAINEANEVLGSPDNRKKYDELGENWKQYDQYKAYQEQARRAGQQTQRRPSASAPPPGFDESDVFGDMGGFSDFFRTFFSGGEAPRSRNTNDRSHDLRATATFTLEECYRGGQQALQIGGQTLRLTLKAGFRDGQRLKIKGKGAAGPNGPGDLYLTLKVQPHGQFERHGDDLHTKSSLDFYTALLGGELVIATLGGPVKITVPAGTAPDTTLRLRGKGMPVYGHPDQHGALLVTLKLQMPTTLSAQEKSLIEQARKLKK